MLDGLDDIDWGSLTHAYGEASDVPGQLRALATAGPEQHDDLLWTLHGNIWHQGTVYEASGHAVPFLLELARTEGVYGREGILRLLYLLANGASYHDAHQHLPSVGERLREQPELEAIVARELAWVAAATRAVADGWPTLVALLSDTDPALRRVAAKVLSAATPPSDEVVAAVKASLDHDADAGVRATLLFTAAELQLGDVGDRLTAALEGPDPLVRLAAALAVCFWGPIPAGERVIETLVAGIAQDGLPYEHLEFGSDRVADIAAALTRLDVPHRLRAAPLLLEQAEQGTFELLAPLVQLTFERPLDEGATLDDLTPLQQRVLTWAARCTWTPRFTMANHAAVLARFGLTTLGRQLAGDR